SLTEAVIPGVKTIGASAFENCTSLSEIDLSNVTTVDANAFKGCTSLQTGN
ncbi:MAG: leucine-rich repeat domain-containing protein, partial [Clostridiales bacterium]|nr:leucine-rich repeat domain-containing protein [Clostridiales bacterium]